MSDAWFEIHHEPMGDPNVTPEERLAAIRKGTERLAAHYAEHGSPQVVTVGQLLYADWFGPGVGYSS